MRWLLILLACAGSLLAQAGTPVFTRVGPLDCGVRLIGATQVQTWCFLRSTDPAPLIHNTISTINVSPTENVRPFLTCPYTDAAGDFYMVMWFVQNASPGSPALTYTIVGNRCTAVPGAAQRCLNVPVQTGTLQ